MGRSRSGILEAVDAENLSSATKLAGALDARAPGLRLGLAFDIQRHSGADEILQCRLIELFALVDIDGAPDVPLEAGVKQAGRVLQHSAFGKGHLHDALVCLSRADDARVGPDGRPHP